MANNFKNIDYGRMLFEALRNFYALNSNGEISIFYKFLASGMSILQDAFSKYDAFRRKEYLIATCKWQIGQLTNVLNYFYDPTFNRIYISQSHISVISDPIFAYTPTNFDAEFSDAPMQSESRFLDRADTTLVTINVPVGVADVFLSDMIATIEQIRLRGIPYVINQF